jgi:hypothetical protein
MVLGLFEDHLIGLAPVLSKVSLDLVVVVGYWTLREVLKESSFLWWLEEDFTETALSIF